MTRRSILSRGIGERRQQPGGQRSHAPSPAWLAPARPPGPADTLRAPDILALQQHLGNRSVARLIDRPPPHSAPSASAAPPGGHTIQRLTFQQVKENREIPHHVFAEIVLWLKERVGDLQGADLVNNNWSRFLEKLDLTTIVNHATSYHTRKRAEQRELSLEEVIGVDLDTLGIQWKMVTQYLVRSPIKRYVEGKIDAQHDPLVILDDASFTRAHLEEYRRINDLDALDEQTRNEQLGMIDSVNGFHSRSGTIYLRKSAAMEANYHFAVHEAIHKYAHGAFKARLGHVFNEAVTELIARDVCLAHNIPISPGVYGDEITLLGEVGPQIGLTAPHYYQAYFEGVVDEPASKLRELLKEDQDLVRFLKAGSAQAARLIYEVAQIVVEELPFDAEVDD